MKYKQAIKFVSAKSKRELKKSYRRLLFAAFKSQVVKHTKKYVAMDKKRLLRLTTKNIGIQIAIRPRIKFVFRLLGALLLLMLPAIYASHLLKENESEIKVNGRAVLVAGRTENTPGDSEIQEISSAVVGKRSPFDLKYPVEGQISQGFHGYHRAFDIATKLNSEIKPLGKGVVDFAGYMPDGKGNVVILNHGEGLKSLYAHMGKINVGVGNEVDTESVIGTVGMTGRTTGPHVHLEIYDYDQLINPGDILPDR